MHATKKNLFSFLIKNAWGVFIVLLALVVFFMNMGSQGYSLDESLSVAVSRTILTFGYPSAWDGHMFLGGANNIFTTVIHGMYFWTWYPWLHFYVIALFYQFFGNDITMLRFPFALFGVATVGMLYFISQDIFKKTWISVLLSIHLIFLLPFFLYVRQVHYYSPSAFFSLVLFWLLLRFAFDAFTKKHILLFLGVSWALLMTNSLIWLSSLPLFAFFILWNTYKKFDGNVLSLKFIITVIQKNMGIIIIILFEGILTFLWFSIMSPFGGKNPAAVYAPGRPMVIVGVLKFLSYGNNYIFPLLLFPVAFFSAWKLKKNKLLWIMVFWILAKLVIYAYVINPHGRFMTDSMPIFMLFFGCIYSYLHKRKKIFLILFLFMITILTNIVSLLPSYLWSSQQKFFRFYPSAFISEFTGSYPPAYIQIAEYIKRQAKPGDLFWSNYTVLEIYLYSNVPSFSPELCKKQTPFSKNLTNPKNIRWYIFYQGKSPTVDDQACLGEKWQTYMEKYYVKKTFSLKKETYAINDPDIVNRQFPTFPISATSVVLYERK